MRKISVLPVLKKNQGEFRFPEMRKRSIFLSCSYKLIDEVWRLIRLGRQWFLIWDKMFSRKQDRWLFL